MIWHSTEVNEVLKELETDDKSGLANGVAEQRIELKGYNIIKTTKKPTYLQRLLAQFKNKTVIALVIISLVSFIVSLMYGVVNSFSSLLIIAIVIVNALISAYHMHTSDNAFDDIKNITNPTATVLREGIVKSVNSALLVPGDIVILEEGDYISADCRIIDCNEFRCNEVTITGDEIPVEKNGDLCLDDITPIEKRSNMVFAGCSVVHGSAKVVVTATGINSEFGKNTTILELTSEKNLPFESELDFIGKIVNTAILVVCVIVFLLGMIPVFKGENFAAGTLNAAVDAVALAVAAIPEGLPAIAAIVIATGIQRMVKDKIIVKDTGALERIGKTEILCVDKTGILTRNKMVLSRVYDGENITDVENEALSEKSSLVLQLAAACSTLENDSTESAIKNACLTYNSLSEKDIESLFPKLNVIPFDSVRKSMTIITMINEKPFAIVKGAPEIVVPNCVGCNHNEILELNNNMANDALRIVCIAARQLDSIPANLNATDIECNLKFVGLVGLIDPPRKAVIDDIESCDRAGIRTIMITGDNLITAKSIARRIGILKDGTRAITGEELSKMGDYELEEKISQYSVFARVTPSDKVRIVKAWQGNKKTVTVTGETVQDTEALTTADIGCAIGRFGADVARGNSDIIISNNNFSSIVYAIRESRGLFDNIRKSVYYLLSCNFAEILTMLVGLIAFSVSPICAAQLLWINLLTDCAPAISLSMEKAEKSVMLRKPYSAIKRLFDGPSALSVAMQSLFICAMALTAYAIGNKTNSTLGTTMAFVVLGISQILHCYNHKIDGSIFNKALFSNRFLNISAILTLFIIIFLTVTPAGYIFSLSQLNFSQLLTCLLLSLLILPFCEILKFIKRFTKR